MFSEGVILPDLAGIRYAFYFCRAFYAINPFMISCCGSSHQITGFLGNAMFANACFFPSLP
jgi:hypothetical protein